MLVDYRHRELCRAVSSILYTVVAVCNRTDSVPFLASLQLLSRELLSRLSNSAIIKYRRSKLL